MTFLGLNLPSWKMGLRTALVVQVVEDSLGRWVRMFRMLRAHREGSEGLLTLPAVPLAQPYRMAVAQVWCQGLSWPDPCGYVPLELSLLETLVSKTHNWHPVPQKLIEKLHLFVLTFLYDSTLSYPGLCHLALSPWTSYRAAL